MQKFTTLDELISETEALILKEDIEEAINQFTNALKLQPFNSEIIIRRAMLYLYSKQFEKASVDIQKAFILEGGENPVIQFLLNFINSALNKKDDARQIPSSSSESLKKTDSKDNLVRANILYNHDKFENAVDECAKVIQIDNDHVEAFCLLARCHFALKRYHQAAAAAEVVMSLDPKIAEVYSIYAMSAFELKFHTAAIEMSTKGIAIENQFAVFYHVRSCSYMALGKYDVAIKDHHLACQLCAENKEGYLQEFDLAHMRYRDLVLDFIADESKQYNSFFYHQKMQDHIALFKEHEKNIKNIIAKTKNNDYLRILFTFCLGELYAKCQLSYFAQFEDEEVDRDKADLDRIERAARYYINALNGLLNNVFIYMAFELNNIKHQKFRLFKQNKSSSLSVTQLEEMESAESMRSLYIRLMIDTVISINKLYIQSERASQFFRQKLPDNFKVVLKKCLNQILNTLAKEKEAPTLWQYLEQHKDNIFGFFNIQVGAFKMDITNHIHMALKI